MKNQVQIALILFFPFYLATVLLTDISLTGFWTDILFSIFLSIIALAFVSKGKTDKPWKTISLKITGIICSLAVFGFFGLGIINPLAWGTLKLRSFYFQPVDKRLFNAYFNPVGSYERGYGNFWICETFNYFPLIEWKVYQENAIQYDFNDDTFEGEPIDNNQIVCSYIRSEIINKAK